MFLANVRILSQYNYTPRHSNKPIHFCLNVTSFDYYDGASMLQSPKLTPYQKEFLRFPDSVIKWSNEHKMTPEGTYVLYLPKSYYDSKNEKYIDTYKVVNEYQKNLFKQRINKYPKEAYYSRNIPEGYEMKRICGVVSVVSPENEALIRQKNSNALIVTSAALAGFTAAMGFGLYKLVEFIKGIK